MIKWNSQKLPGKGFGTHWKQLRLYSTVDSHNYAQEFSSSANLQTHVSERLTDVIRQYVTTIWFSPSYCSSYRCNCVSYQSQIDLGFASDGRILPKCTEGFGHTVCQQWWGRCKIIIDQVFFQDQYIFDQVFF